MGCVTRTEGEEMNEAKGGGFLVRKVVECEDPELYEVVLGAGAGFLIQCRPDGVCVWEGKAFSELYLLLASFVEKQKTIDLLMPSTVEREKEKEEEEEKEQDNKEGWQQEEEEKQKEGGTEREIEQDGDCTSEYQDCIKEHRDVLVFEVQAAVDHLFDFAGSSADPPEVMDGQEMKKKVTSIQLDGTEGGLEVASRMVGECYYKSLLFFF